MIKVKVRKVRIEKILKEYAAMHCPTMNISDRCTDYLNDRYDIEKDCIPCWKKWVGYEPMDD